MNTKLKLSYYISKKIIAKQKLDMCNTDAMFSKMFFEFVDTEHAERDLSMFKIES